MPCRSPSTPAAATSRAPGSRAAPTPISSPSAFSRASTSTAFSSSTTPSAPAASSRCVSCPKAGKWCSGWSAPSFRSSRKRTTSSAASTRRPGTCRWRTSPSARSAGFRARTTATTSPSSRKSRSSSFASTSPERYGASLHCGHFDLRSARLQARLPAEQDVRVALFACEPGRVQGRRRGVHDPLFTFRSREAADPLARLRRHDRRRHEYLLHAEDRLGHRQQPLSHGRPDARRELRGFSGDAQLQGCGLTRRPVARIVAGLGLSHVPSVGVAYDRGKMQTPAWKPLADAYVPVREWLARLGPDVAVVGDNDHGADFMVDQDPTFPLGAAERFGLAHHAYEERR